MLAEFDHVFFDLDRTLWDFEVNSRLTLQEIYAELNLQQRLGVPFEVFVPEYHRINDIFWQQYRDGIIDKEGLRYARFDAAFRFFGVKDAVLAEKMGSAYVERSPRRTALVDGTNELLRHLAHVGVPMSVITNGFDEVQHLKMQASGIAHYFKHVFTSEMVGVRKPDPIIFNHALAVTGTHAHKVVMVGDHYEADIDGALRAGWHAVYLLPDGELPEPHHRLMVVRSLHELLP
jgi:putative hydrolase of the HAD superfamily